MEEEGVKRVSIPLELYTIIEEKIIKKGALRYSSVDDFVTKAVLEKLKRMKLSPKNVKVLAGPRERIVEVASSGRKSIPYGYIECPYCHAVVKPKSRFHWSVFIFLLLIGLIPGLLYWLLRHGRKKCPACGTPLG